MSTQLARELSALLSLGERAVHLCVPGRTRERGLWRNCGVVERNSCASTRQRVADGRSLCTRTKGRFCIKGTHALNRAKGRERRCRTKRERGCWPSLRKKGIRERKDIFLGIFWSGSLKISGFETPFHVISKARYKETSSSDGRGQGGGLRKSRSCLR